MNDDFSELLGDFLLEAEERRARVEELALALAAGEVEDPAATLAEIGRELHTLKGNAGMMGLAEIQAEAHRLEDRVAALDGERPRVDPVLDGVDRIGRWLAELGGEPAPTAAETAAEGAVRVPLRTLDHLSELMAGLAVARHHLEESSAAVGGLDPGEPGFDERFRSSWRRLEETRVAQERLLRGVRSELEEIQRVPFRTLFGRLRRMVHDESQARGKRVRLVTRGEEAPIDRSLVELAGEVLGHLVRNAVIHGIESPEERKRREKPETGSILVSATVGSGTLELEVVDDGDGVRLERLRRAAGAAGGGAERRDLHALLFQAGLSTLEEADLGAGRGMGLAAVEAAVGRYGGAIDVATAEGVGTRFGLRLPASTTVAIALMVEADGELYALPVTAVVETVSAASLGDPGESWGEWRGRPVEKLDLGVLLGTSEEPPRRSAAVVVLSEGRHAALLVDHFGDLREIVVRELDRLAGRPRGIGGSTILGDGRVVMIIDPRNLARAEESVA